MLVEYLVSWSVLIVLLTLIIVPRDKGRSDTIGIWTDIDGLVVGASLALGKMLYAPLPHTTEDVEIAAKNDRIFAGRVAAAGLLLLAVLPFHRLFFTDPLIDGIWEIVGAISSVANKMEIGFLHIAPEWREQEYYLWELAAFLWTMFQLGSSQLREIRHLLTAKLVEPASAFTFGIAYSVAVIGLAVLGLVVLLVAVSLYVLMFEAIVVALFTIMELLLVRVLFRGGKVEDAKRGMESALFIEIPALLAFLLAAVFVGSVEGFTSYSSHWSHSFAAGASALDLVLANVGLLMIRTLRRPSERALHGE